MTAINEITKDAIKSKHNSDNFRNGWEAAFGCAHMKSEGAPLHPDDIDSETSTEQSEKQLAAYNEHYGIKQ